MSKPNQPKPNQPHSQPLKANHSAAAVPSVFPGQQWRQVLERDASADGQFVYAVQPTKIYCRPSCPSRRPTRKSVRFYPSAAAAQEAGFHACQLCQPDLAAPRPDPHAAVIAAATDYLAAHATERTRLTDLAQATGVGRLALLRGFRRVLGVSPGDYARAQRLARRKEAPRPVKHKPDAELPPAPESTSKSASAAVAKPTGTKSIADQSGLTQHILRAGGAGQLIRYATAPSPLGRLLVAATANGICAILFGRDDAELLADLRQRFDRAQLAPAKGNSGWLAEALAFVLSQTTAAPLAATFPLDLRATDFQQRVWRALQQIPRGQTRSYSAIARELGSPTAARAVASACAANPIALAIPCHRAVAQDGSLAGYRWGLARKQKILTAEAAI